jgi:hypothetical protein
MGAWKYPRFISCIELVSLRSLVRYHVQHSLFINYTKYFNTDNGCNNMQNSYVLIILCFWGEGDWLGAGGGGGGGGGEVRNISSPLMGGIKYFPTLLGVPNFMLEFWNTLHPPVHIFYDRSLMPKLHIWSAIELI